MYVDFEAVDFPAPKKCFDFHCDFLFDFLIVHEASNVVDLDLWHFVCLRY